MKTDIDGIIIHADTIRVFWGGGGGWDPLK